MASPERAARPTVVRVHAVSDTGYPYEIHHLRDRVAMAPASTPDPVAAAERALAELVGSYPDWVKAALARTSEALIAHREARDEPTRAELWRCLHALKGDAGFFDRQDLAEGVAIHLVALETGPVPTQTLDHIAAIIAEG